MERCYCGLLGCYSIVLITTLKNLTHEVSIPSILYVAPWIELIHMNSAAVPHLASAWTLAVCLSSSSASFFFSWSVSCLRPAECSISPSSRLRRDLSNTQHTSLSFTSFCILTVGTLSCDIFTRKSIRDALICFFIRSNKWVNKTLCSEIKTLHQNTSVPVIAFSLTPPTNHSFIS